MAQIRVERGTLAVMLRSHGEDDLAAWASSITDDELMRIGTLGVYYVWSEDALALRGSMGGARALSLATIDVLERTGRELRRQQQSARFSRPQRCRRVGNGDRRFRRNRRTRAFHRSTLAPQQVVNVLYRPDQSSASSLLQNTWFRRLAMPLLTSPLPVWRMADMRGSYCGQGASSTR